MENLSPGTFWYDFVTGPALGGIGALLAAGTIAFATLSVSRHRREDAGRDRAAERLRARREEWFRRVQWAYGLTLNSDDDVHASGYDVLDYLGRSELASRDDEELLWRLILNSELDAAAKDPAELVDTSEYLLDTEVQHAEEDQ